MSGKKHGFRTLHGMMAYGGVIGMMPLVHNLGTRGKKVVRVRVSAVLSPMERADATLFKNDASWTSEQV